MRKRNLLDDLKRLLSLPSRDMKRACPGYIYEDSSSALAMLFSLAERPKSRLLQNNIITLLKSILDHTDEFYASIPDWMVLELNNFIQNPGYTDHEKALVLSAFDSEELFRRVLSFERFVQRFMDIEESFEEYIVREIRDTRTRLFDIFSTIRAKTKPDAMLSMIHDLKDSEEREAAELLELFAYLEHPALSSAAIDALSSTQNTYAAPLLSSLSKFHSLSPSRDNAPIPHQDNYSGTAAVRRAETNERTPEIRISLPAGDGSVAALVGKKMGRNRYCFSQMLLKAGRGIKDISVYTSLTLSEYDEIKRHPIMDVPLYTINENLLRKILGHFLAEAQEAGFGIPADVVALKSMFCWSPLEPEKYRVSTPLPQPREYRAQDLEKFPLNSWWLNDNRLYRMLFPLRHLSFSQVPQVILTDIAGLYVEHAGKHLPPLCDLAMEIVLHASPKKGKRMAGIFQAIKTEIANPPDDPFSSCFLTVQILNSFFHTLRNINKGWNSMELS